MRTSYVNVYFCTINFLILPILMRSVKPTNLTIVL